MAALDASIILQGQPVNMLGILDASNRMAGEQKDRLHQQEYRNMLATNGAGIMSGDQNALNALAGYDPAAALGIQSTRQEMDFGRQKMGILNAQEKRAAEEYARGLSKADRDAQAAEIEQGHRVMMGARSPQEWDALAQQIGMPDLVGMFDQREGLAMKYLGWAEIMKQAFPEPVAPLSGPGKVQADINAGLLPDGTPLFAPGSSVTVNNEGSTVKPIGTDGQILVPDPSQPSGYRVEIAPGSKLDMERKDAAAKAEQRAEGAAGAADVVLGKIKQAKKLLGQASWYNPATGFGAEKAAGIGGSNAANMKAIVDTISANIAFGELQAMREASPTGGALGAVSERELVLLSSTLASLSQSQSPEQFAKNLDELETIYSGIMAKAAAYPNASEYGFDGGAQPATSAAPAGIDADVWDVMTPEERALFQ